MFRLLIFFVLLGFVILLTISIINIIKNMSTNKNQTKNDKFGVEEIEHIIDSIKFKITKAEMDSHSGIEGAEKEVQYWKDQLEQTQKLKERTKNL
jgi:hypothetical protein